MISSHDCRAGVALLRRAAGGSRSLFGRRRYLLLHRLLLNRLLLHHLLLLRLLRCLRGEGVHMLCILLLRVRLRCLWLMAMLMLPLNPAMLKALRLALLLLVDLLLSEQRRVLLRVEPVLCSRQ
jgi:hypothetical protein